MLNYNLDRISNGEYMRRTYEICDAILINCLSDYREGDWEWEESAYYYSPETVFGYTQELTRDLLNMSLNRTHRKSLICYLHNI